MQIWDEQDGSLPVEASSMATEEILAPIAKRSHSRSAFRELAETLLLTALIFIGVNTATGRFRIEGSSMYPTLKDGEYVIVDKISYDAIGPIRFGQPYRGDIVVFRYPKDPSRDFIKRVIGLPGDTVEIRQGHVWVDGLPLDEPYIAQFGNYSDTRTLGPNEFYVLGDNRNNSSDSHTWGVLPGEDLIGKASIIYWPLGNLGWVPHHTYAVASSGP